MGQSEIENRRAGADLPRIALAPSHQRNTAPSDCGTALQKSRRFKNSRVAGTDRSSKEQDAKDYPLVESHAPIIRKPAAAWLLRRLLAVLGCWSMGIIAGFAAQIGIGMAGRHGSILPTQHHARSSHSGGW